MNKVNTASGADSASGGTMSTARLDQLREEVGQLKVTGGAANPERLAGKWGIGLTIFGFVIAFVSWWSAVNAGDFASFDRAAVFAGLGIGVALIGIVIWLRNSLTRYMRFWIIRLVYEQREQTDRLIEALKQR